jgi:hypothetical protein
MENIKESYPSNVSTVAELDTLLTNVPIPRRRKMMKKFTTRKTNTRRNSIRKIKTYTLKKTSALQT